MVTDPMRVSQVLVGLPDVVVLGVDELVDRTLVVHVEQAGQRPACLGCGSLPVVKDRQPVRLFDLPVYGRRTELCWRKFRFSCKEQQCAVTSWTWSDERIAAPRLALTDRAGRWATEQVGRRGRTVSEVATELGCDWHTLNDTVIAYGAQLVDDPGRFGEVAALGLDETLFCRRGRWRQQHWCTSVVDVGRAQLLDVVEGRDASGPSRWVGSRPQAWRDGVSVGVLDLSGPYRKTFDDTLPQAVQVADPFHVVRLANQRLDECRRRVQNQTLGHRGRKVDPLYRARRLLTKAHERLDDRGEQRLRGLLEAGDPGGDVRMARHAKEMVRAVYDIDDQVVAAQFVAELAEDLQDENCPPEARSLGRTLKNWFLQIVAWHGTFVSNGPTEAMNNLIKRIKRVGFGFRRFEHYRVRVLLHAGKPNWDLLGTVRPR